MLTKATFTVKTVISSNIIPIEHNISILVFFECSQNSLYWKYPFFVPVTSEQFNAFCWIKENFYPKLNSLAYYQLLWYINEYQLFCVSFGQWHSGLHPTLRLQHSSPGCGFSQQALHHIWWHHRQLWCVQSGNYRRCLWVRLQRPCFLCMSHVGIKLHKNQWKPPPSADMVVSGVPKENGIKHAGEIASMALDLISVCHAFKIPHKPTTQLKIRAGIHSGQHGFH